MKLKISLLSIFFCCAISAQDKDSIKAKKFSIPEYDKEGKLSCVIRGDSGQIFGREALISKVLVEIHHKDSPLMLKSPKCRYFLDKKRCSSNEDVDINGDGVKITGTGFDIDNANKKIFIRSNVKVVWKKAKANLNKKTKDQPEDKK